MNLNTISFVLVGKAKKISFTTNTFELSSLLFLMNLDYSGEGYQRYYYYIL
jgi:hypothetical protein